MTAWVLGALVLAWSGPAPGAAREATPAVTEIERRLAAGETLAALELAERTARAEPQQATAQFLLGVALMDLRRDAEAVAVFTAFNERWPERPEAQNNIGVLLARAGRLDEALAALQAALRADPGHRPARLNLAEVHLALAVRAWEQAASVAPLEPPQQARLQTVRALLPGAGR